LKAALSSLRAVLAFSRLKESSLITRVRVIT